MCCPLGAAEWISTEGGWVSEFELLDRKESALRAEADVLDKKAAEIHRRREAVDETLQRIAEARATLQELLVDEPETCGGLEEDHAERETDGEELGSNAPSSEEEHEAGPEDAPDSARGPVGMEEARRRAVALLATSGRKMRARAIAEAIGEDVSTPARIETTRGRLKTLVTEGTLAEEPQGVFFIAASGRPEDAEQTPERKT